MYIGNVTPRDGEYVEAYLRNKTLYKAAEECGVSRETIARAVRRAGIQLTGRQYNGKNQKNEKISDAKLIEEAKTKTCHEIATEYGMSEERVFRRARRLGVDLNTNWSGGHWKRRAHRYGVSFEDGITLNALYERDNGVCQICGGLTDTADIINGHIGKRYPTLDHIVPLSKGGGHTWDNVQLAHMACNSGKGDKVGIAWT